jgi:predicted nucleotidyltransferase
MIYPNLQGMKNRQLINVDQYYLDNIILAVLSGSAAYGTETSDSDLDVFAITIPQISDIHPYNSGTIYGFDQPPSVFESFQQQHIPYDPTMPLIDVNIWSIVKLFQIAKKGGPNVIDVLFAPERCVYITSPVGKLLRDHRQVFLSKECAKKFLGMSNSFRNYDDYKSQSHMIRTLYAARDILKYHDYVTDKHVTTIRSIKEGQDYYDLDILTKILHEEIFDLMRTSSLQDKSDVNEIRTLLLECLN